jgi:hypothetical protein
VSRRGQENRNTQVTPISTTDIKPTDNVILYPVLATSQQKVHSSSKELRNRAKDEKNNDKAKNTNPSSISSHISMKLLPTTEEQKAKVKQFLFS